MGRSAAKSAKPFTDEDAQKVLSAFDKGRDLDAWSRLAREVRIGFSERTVPKTPDAEASPVGLANRIPPRSPR